MSGQTRTPRTDAYRDSVSTTEICKHPLHEFMGALDFARALEIENAELREALKGLSDMYSQTWDKVGGGLIMMGQRSIKRFEDAHANALELLSKSKGAE